MLDVIEIITFKLWLRGLCDRAAVARTNAHPRIVSLCSIGGTRTAGGDRSEMRFHHEFGYRLYFLRDGATVVVPYGGDKTNQQRDIERGARLAKRPRGKERSTHAMEGSGNTRAPAHPRRRAPVFGRVRRRELRRLQPQPRRHLGYCAGTEFGPPFPRNRYDPQGALQRVVGERQSDLRNRYSERASVRHAVADYGIDAPPLPANPATNRAPGVSTRCSNARVDPKHSPDATD